VFSSDQNETTVTWHCDSLSIEPEGSESKLMFRDVATVLSVLDMDDHE